MTIASVNIKSQSETSKRRTTGKLVWWRRDDGTILFTVTCPESDLLGLAGCGCTELSEEDARVFWDEEGSVPRGTRTVEVPFYEVAQSLVDALASLREGVPGTEDGARVLAHLEGAARWLAVMADCLDRPDSEGSPVYCTWEAVQ